MCLRTIQYKYVHQNSVRRKRWCENARTTKQMKRERSQDTLRFGEHRIKNKLTLWVLLLYAWTGWNSKFDEVANVLFAFLYRLVVVEKVYYVHPFTFYFSFVQNSMLSRFLCVCVCVLLFVLLYYLPPLATPVTSSLLMRIYYFYIYRIKMRVPRVPHITGELSWMRAQHKWKNQLWFFGKNLAMKFKTPHIRALCMCTEACVGSCVHIFFCIFVWLFFLTLNCLNKFWVVMCCVVVVRISCANILRK